MAAKRQQSSHTKNRLETNPFEGFESIAKGVTQTAKDQGKATVEDFFAQLLGDLGGGAKTEKKAHAPAAKGGELKPGEAIYFGGKKTEAKAKAPEAPRRPDIAPALNYHAEMRRSSEMISRREKGELEHKMQEIMAELKRLMSSSKVLENQFKDVAVTQKPTNVGKYHINFLDFVLLTIRQARIKIEDSGAWLAAMKGKKGKKSYWGQFKSKGTSFSQNNERAVATQTG